MKGKERGGKETETGGVVTEGEREEMGKVGVKVGGGWEGVTAVAAMEEGTGEEGQEDQEGWVREEDTEGEVSGEETEGAGREEEMEGAEWEGGGGEEAEEVEATVEEGLAAGKDLD